MQTEGEDKEPWMDEELRQELLTMAEEDQGARRRFWRHDEDGVLIPEDLGDVDHLVAVDARNTARLKDIVRERGWPGASLVGDDGAQAAWLLAQHTDADPAFQRRCLDLIQAAVAAGEASPRNGAYLTDRVALAEDRPQVYGTQVELCLGERQPRPLIDPDRVDERRRAVGLGPLSEYLKSFGQG